MVPILSLSTMTRKEKMEKERHTIKSKLMASYPQAIVRERNKEMELDAEQLGAEK